MNSEGLVEGEELPRDARNLAALVASKVYYYLAEYDEALSFALVAGPAFEAERSVAGGEEYIETIICKSRIPIITQHFTTLTTRSFSKGHRQIHQAPKR